MRNTWYKFMYIATAKEDMRNVSRSDQFKLQYVGLNMSIDALFYLL